MLRIKLTTTTDTLSGNTVYQYNVERKGKLLFWDHWFFVVRCWNLRDAEAWVKREIAVTKEEVLPCIIS